MDDARFLHIPWQTTLRPVTMEERSWLRSISDREADEITTFVMGPSAADPAMREEVGRLRDLLEARAVALAEERAWASLSPPEQARLIELAGERHVSPTEYSARGLIDMVLLLLADELGKDPEVLAGAPGQRDTERFLRLYGFDPP